MEVGATHFPTIGKLSYSFIACRCGSCPSEETIVGLFLIRQFLVDWTASKLLSSDLIWKIWFPNTPHLRKQACHNFWKIPKGSDCSTSSCTLSIPTPQAGNLQTYGQGISSPGVSRWRCHWKQGHNHLETSNYYSSTYFPLGSIDSNLPNCSLRLRGFQRDTYFFTSPEWIHCGITRTYSYENKCVIVI